MKNITAYRLNYQFVAYVIFRDPDPAQLRN
jgi:hypothetical protein